MNWISVKDRLPEKSDKYLVYIPGEYTGSHTVARYRDSSGKWLASQAHAWFDGVTHWMPLTEPPEVTIDHAHWITHGDYERYECSHCGKDAPYSVAGNPWQTNYCPHCGARMSMGEIK